MQETTTGRGATPLYTKGAAHVAYAGQFPGTVYEHTFVDVPNYTGHGGATGVQAAELVGVSLPAGVRQLTITAVSGPDAGTYGDFAGVYIAVNQASLGDAQTALSHIVGTTTVVTAGGTRRFVAAGETIQLDSDSDITNVYVTALDLDATPANTIVLQAKVPA